MAMGMAIGSGIAPRDEDETSNNKYHLSRFFF